MDLQDFILYRRMQQTWLHLQQTVVQHKVSIKFCKEDIFWKFQFFFIFCLKETLGLRYLFENSVGRSRGLCVYIQPFEQTFCFKQTDLKQIHLLMINPKTSFYKRDTLSKFFRLGCRGPWLWSHYGGHCLWRRFLRYCTCRTVRTGHPGIQGVRAKGGCWCHNR